MIIFLRVSADFVFRIVSYGVFFKVSLREMKGINMGFYIVFKDVNKDFNFVGGEGLWKIFVKVGRFGKII